MQASNKKKHHTTPADDGPIRLNRQWQVTTQAGELERKLKEAGIETTLRASVSRILDRCKAGVQLVVEAFEVVRPISAEAARAILDKKGLTYVCSCEFASWAISHSADVDPTKSWYAELPGEGSILFCEGQVHTLGVQENLTTEMMLLVISKKQASKHRKKTA